MPRARIEHGAACVIDDGSGRRVAAVSATRPSQGISVTICALRDAGMKTAQPSARRAVACAVRRKLHVSQKTRSCAAGSLLGAGTKALLGGRRKRASWWLQRRTRRAPLCVC